MAHIAWPQFQNPDPRCLIPLDPTLQTTRQQNPNANQSAIVLGHNGTGVNCTNYHTELLAVLTPAVANEQCAYDPTKRQGYEAAVAIGKYRNIAAYDCPQAITNNKVLVGKNSSNPQLHIVEFKNAIVGCLVAYAVFGPQFRGDCLESQQGHAKYNSFVEPLVNFFLTHLNPHNELEFQKIVKATPTNFSKNVKQKVKTFGIWSETYVLARIGNVGYNEGDDKMCRGVPARLAVVADWIISDDLFRHVDRTKIFAEDVYLDSAFWSRNKTWKYVSVHRRISLQVQRHIAVAPVLPSIEQQTGIDTGWVLNVAQQQPRLEPAAQAQFAQHTARRRDLARQVAQGWHSTQDPDRILDEDQQARVARRAEDIYNQANGGGHTCAICMDGGTVAMMGNPPTYATGENCNHIYHRGCLQDYVSRRMGAAMPTSATNNCPLCGVTLSRCINVSEFELGTVVDNRTDDEIQEDIRNLIDESFEEP